MRPVALAALLLLVPLAIPQADAGCAPVVGATRYGPLDVEPGLWTCDVTGDGSPDIILLQQGVGAEGASAGVAGGASLVGPYLGAGVGGGASFAAPVTVVPVAPVGVGFGAACATIVGDAGCDRAGWEALLFAPGVGAGHAGALTPKSFATGVGLDTILGSAGAGASGADGVIVACAFTPVGFLCQPVTA